MIKDYQDYLELRQQSFDQERLKLQSNIGSYETQMTNLTEELDIAKRSHQTLTDDHKSRVEYLIAQKRALADALKKQVHDLKAAVENCRDEIRKLENNTQMETEVALRKAIVLNPFNIEDDSRIN